MFTAQTANVSSEGAPTGKRMPGSSNTDLKTKRDSFSVMATSLGANCIPTSRFKTTVKAADINEEAWATLHSDRQPPSISRVVRHGPNPNRGDESEVS